MALRFSSDTNPELVSVITSPAQAPTAPPSSPPFGNSAPSTLRTHALALDAHRSVIKVELEKEHMLLLPLVRIMVLNRVANCI